MARVLTCIEFNDTTKQCEQQAWIDQSDWTTYLPTVEQATAVGSAYFIGLMTLAALKSLLNPKTTED